jgi:iron complex transport system ATP-binding protein
MELMHHISVNSLTFGYGSRNILNEINFNISEGEIVTLLGPNGSGKTTLIRLILGFLKPLNGHIMIDGVDLAHVHIKELARKIAYVPQIHKTVFPYSVTDVVLMGRIPHKGFFYKYSKEDIRIANEAMERLSILHLADRPYTEISGGERQLTIIVRALAQGAKTLILDEPASGLDYGNQIKLLEEIVKLSKEGYTFVKSTHSPEHALWIADRAIMIKNGSVASDGQCDEVISNENLFMLYGAKVDIVKVNGHLRTCVPQKLNL